MKTGLILEGGAMRGMFTCGVTDVFMEHGITFDGAAGISAGAIFGCNYKSKQVGRAVRYNKKYSKDPRYCSIRSLIKTGDLYGADFCYRELPEKLDVFDKETFEKNPMEFYIGATNVYTGEAVYHKCTDGGRSDIEWMRASASMPLVSRPVDVDGYTLLDGGIVDPVPYEYMKSIGYDRNVIILTQPKGYRKTKSRAFPLMRVCLRKYPEIVEAMRVRHVRYNKLIDKINELEEKGKVLVIRPTESLGVKRTEKSPNKLEWVYQCGRSVAKDNIEKVLKFLRN